MPVEAPPIVFTELRAEHWPEVARIYAEGIAAGHATFETEVPSWQRCWDASHLPDHRFVALRDGEVVGWVAGSGVSDRCVYAGVVEDSVYVAACARGQGVGLRLLGRLVSSTEAAGIWTIQTGIFPENEASLRLQARALQRHRRLSETTRSVQASSARSAASGSSRTRKKAQLPRWSRSTSPACRSTFRWWLTVG
jgi:L-amino acid N-acyltransferase YncA